ncbi:hypothetical protein [Desulfobulbus elongatus]|uniref:hypothetical protein n=1 Tax=Desulfobulbus elongatus TaxID=53332 RepID=UPI0012FA95E5|nr:hypothetical protein [Desulfobulbus elongatus]
MSDVPDHLRRQWLADAYARDDVWSIRSAPGILNERQRALLPVLAAILPCRWNSLGIAVRAQAFTCFY